MALKRLVSLLLFLALAVSCKSHLPRDGNALLASLRFSAGLKLEEEFISSNFEYTLKVAPSSNLQGFFVICIPDNPSSKCKLFVAGVEIPLFYISVTTGMPNFSFEILVTSPNKTEQKYKVNVVIL